MDYDYLKYLKEQNVTLRLLRSENFPLIISFLYNRFKAGNEQVILAEELESRLTDYLLWLRESYGEELYPGSSRSYLERWTNDSFLRKFYQADVEEAAYELTPYTERAFEWVTELERREFVGTESRLYRIFELLNEMVHQSSSDPAKRVAELEARRDELDREINAIKAGSFTVLDSTQLKERYYELVDNARRLLADFKEIEYNFRELDREAREEQLNRSDGKGKVLEHIFEVEDLIWDSDQGRSFRAFWEFIMSGARQKELDELIRALSELPELSDMKEQALLRRFKFSLIEAGSKVNRTNHLLIEHLSRYLDDRSFLNNKRIMGILAEVKQLALERRDELSGVRSFCELELKPNLSNVMERGLFSPSKSALIRDIEIGEGEAEADISTLYNQVYIDLEELKQNIRLILRGQSQVSLPEVVRRFPVRKGAAELIAYLELAAQSEGAHINRERSEWIEIENSESGDTYRVKVPLVIYTKV